MSDDGSDEDTIPRPKRKIKRVVVMSSSSGSDSDENIILTGTRRKRMRVVSDAESESSGSSVIRAGTRRKRTLSILRDSDGDSDTSGWATDHSDAPKISSANGPAAAKPASGFASDSSEGNSDKCSICLMRFTTQEVGTPQNCEHIFCLDCITEWSKNVNTCPVDRITFDSIVVRACAGGRVIRTEPVKVLERRPSVDMLVVEDPTVCEICGSAENEQSMLLCDGCDLGFHMQCLTPPLTQVPLDQWLCPNCDNILDVIQLSEVEDLFSGIVDIELPLGSRAVALRQPRNVRRSSRLQNLDEPSTSTGRRANGANADDAPTSSRGRRNNRRSNTIGTTTRRRTTGTQRRKRNIRRTKTVIIEYEEVENGKLPVTKTVKRRVKKRRVKKRQPRTAARRSYVRASVHAKLATMNSDPRQMLSEASRASVGVQDLSLRRHRAGIPALSLLGNPHELDYFSENEQEASEGATTAVATRPNSRVISAYRQARRKMISIPSPPHATAASDVLSDILESQTLLHSRNSVVEVTVDGSVNIKLQKRRRDVPKREADENRRVDPAKANEDAARKAPSYPGQPRGGGWGGGYRGTYRDTPGTYRAYDPAAPAPRAAAPPAPAPAYGSNGARHHDDDYGGYGRRAHPADAPYDRRRPPDARHSLGAAWPPYPPPRPPPHPPHPPHPPPRPPRSSLDNPLDMRVGGAPARPDKPYRPLPEPPVFRFDKTPDVDRSEDERSDPGLVIDTEKYDPTEPTNDDDSGDDDRPAAAPAPAPALAPPAVMQGLLAGLDSGGVSVPAAVLDSAVRQVLSEHRARLAPRAPSDDDDDDDDDGDCPNFSIYSATSVHIASDAGAAPAAAAPPPAPPAPDDLADLVQEDDGSDPATPPAPAAAPAPAPAPAPASPVDDAKRKLEAEYKERVSKRCPITTNPRNPIKIKLNTPSLIKRQVTLYDEEEEAAADDEPADGSQPAADDQVAADAPRPARGADDFKGIEGGTPEPEPPEVKDEAPALSPEEPERPAAASDGEDDATPPPPSVPDGGESDNEEDIDDIKSPPLERASTPDERMEEGTEDEPIAASDEELDEGDDDEKPEDEVNSEDDASEVELPPSPRPDGRGDEPLEKMTESISETEDERSYTPCLDENKSKDTSFETDKDKGIEGLDTEMISEDEGNGLFSEEERPRSRTASPAGSPAGSPRASPGGSPASRASRASRAPRPGPAEDGEIPDRRRDKDRAEGKRKRKKEAKRDTKREARERTRAKTKKGEVAFKKLSKSGKERNYRDRDRERERRDSSDGADKKRRRKEKRKDLERYDVRTVVTEARRQTKDAFGRDVSPRPRSRSPASSSRRRASPSPPPPSPSPPPPPPPPPPPRPRRREPSPRSASSPRRRRSSGSRARRRRSASRGRKRRRSGSRTPSPRAKPKAKRRRRAEERAAAAAAAARRKSPKARRRRSARPPSALALAAPAWSPPSVDSRLLSPRTPPPEPPPEPRRRRERPRHKRARDAPGPSKEVFTSGDNILVSVSFKEQERTGSPDRRERRERRRERRRRRRMADADADTARPVAIIDLERSPFRELTPSPRNVIVLSDSEQGPAEAAATATATAGGPDAPAGGPDAPADAAPAPSPAAAPAPAAGPALVPAPAAGDGSRGPATPPEPPSSPDAYDPFEPTRSASPSPSPSPSPPPARAASPPRPSITLETAQKTNLSADDVIDRRPLSPMEKVMALLQSTRDVSPEPPPASQPGPAVASPPGPAPVPAGGGPGTGPGAGPASGAVLPTPRIVLPDAPRPQPPKLFLAKPSPIKSDPIKPLQSTKLAPMPRADSPYSPGSSDFGELFEPPGRRRELFDELLGRRRSRRATHASHASHATHASHAAAAKVPVKLNRRRGKTQVGVKIDEDNLKILDDLPSSAVEMQVKSKFLKKLNRQERVVEEVKLVLKPHYNKKHVTKDEYKDILRRAVPKICHNKSGEINPTKIQALVEAYVKKFRKKHKLGLA